MPFRLTPFVNGDFYHLFNRGLEKQQIFASRRDYSYFTQALFYYQIQNPKPKFSIYRKSKIFPVDSTKKIVDILCYCLMPNHFHLLVRQKREGGITEFMRKFIHSYTKYRNAKYHRQGPVFQGMFKAVRVETDEQLIHLSRYIHLNPLVSSVTEDLNSYPWSSYGNYIGLMHDNRLTMEEVLNFFTSPTEYQNFVMEQANYATTLELLKHEHFGADDEDS